MIVNIRGTGGSGKSTVVRRVMERYLVKNPHYIVGRRQPFGYDLKGNLSGRPTLYVVGHYETPCGGGDTIPSVENVFESVREHASRGDDVLFEGIISQDDTRRTVDLHRSFPLLVIFLNTSLDECLKSIRVRRDERGDERPLNPKNTESRMRRCASHWAKLRDAGLDCLKLGREDAYVECVRRLGLDSQQNEYLINPPNFPGLSYGPK